MSLKKDMKEKESVTGGIEKKIDSLSHKREPSVVILALLLLLYAFSLILVNMSTIGTGVIMLHGNAVPIVSFTGVFSSISNICVIFMAVFYGKKGYIFALSLLLIQFPRLIILIFREHNFTSLPGVFSTLLTITAITLIYTRNKKISGYQQIEVDYLKKQQKLSQRLFEQTATALVSAVDAKDKYTHGHSTRVAEYSSKIARLAGKSEEECREIYFAGLLHDVGKIGIDDRIINKNGKLTPEEYDVIKTHPDMGNQILISITEYPYLSIGAHYHHERYDGKGYPDGLIGEDIPEIARIIAVADAYDAMSSKRSYRDTIPQHKIREEIVKGIGTQFDPKFATIMLHLIDKDEEYEMQERSEVKELAGKNYLNCREYREDISEGILLDRRMIRLHMQVSTAEDYRGREYIPSIILFDSLDGRFHNDERNIRDMLYLEYAEVRFDGKVRITGARTFKTELSEYVPVGGLDLEELYAKGIKYEVEAVRYKDHVLIKIMSTLGAVKVTFALEDSVRFAYLSLTGEHCDIRNVQVAKDVKEIDSGFITRIAEEISYIDGPEGDIPNLQVNGWCVESSKPFVIGDETKISFHSKSLPTSRLIWHCPYLQLFASDNGRIGGPGYRELVLVRFDGEDWESDDKVKNEILVQKDDSFTNWDAWKKLNKNGMDCEITVRRKGNTITVNTANGGIDIKCVTDITDEVGTVYGALTGDQVVLTNIRLG